MTDLRNAWRARKLGDIGRDGVVALVVAEVRDVLGRGPCPWAKDVAIIFVQHRVVRPAHEEAQALWRSRCEAATAQARRWVTDHIAPRGATAGETAARLADAGWHTVAVAVELWAVANARLRDAEDEERAPIHPDQGQLL